MDITDLVYIDSTGYHYADYPTFLTWRQSQYQDIYGIDVYLGPDSQDGQLVAIQAQADFQTAQLGAAVYNSFSPTTAQGIGLSRNVQINGLSREIATNSTVDLTIVGVAGTTITNGIASDSLNQQWVLPTPTTIPNSGTITVTATASVVGALNAVPDSITTIFTPTLGWQTVNNASAASPGAPVETDSQLRIRQSISTSNPSQTVFDGTKGAVANIPGVTASQGYENFTNATDGNGLPPHSISMVVEGGDSTVIAQTILNHKTPGTDTYGSTSIIVYDAHGMPVNISFFRPTVATIAAQITITTLTGWSSDFIVQIQDAVASFISANGIGNTIQYTQLFISAYLVGTPAYGTFDIESIELNKNGGSFSAANVSLLFNEIPVCDPTADVTVIT